MAAWSWIWKRLRPISNQPSDLNSFSGKGFLISNWQTGIYIPVRRLTRVKPGRRQAFGGVVVLALILAACQSGFVPSAPAPGTSLSADLPEPTAEPQAEVLPTAAGVVAEDQSPTVELGADAGQPPAPTVRAALAATDPATVNLASGKPTLVEFFAYW